MRIRAFAAVSALAVASAPLLATPAMSADATIGETFSDSTSCGTGFTLLQLGSPRYAAPDAGVLTSWSTTNSTGTAYDIAFRTGRSGPESTYVITAAPPAITVAAGETSRRDVRIPVQAGDLIGLYIPQQEARNSSCGKVVDNPESSYAFAPGDAPALRPSGDTSFELNVSATYEADADGDGFGDTTQDECPTQATTQGTCTVAGDTTSPQTTITKITSKKVNADATGSKARAKVTIAFEADEPSTFECRVDGSAYAPCSSPLRLKLKATKHFVKVRATDTAGNVDATPAARTYQVKRAKAQS